LSYTELKKVLDPEFKVFTKADFIAYARTVDGRIRVGGPKGKGRITAKRALALLA
jgi:hypothetical protein